MHNLIEFQTARLRLRQWQHNDRMPFAALNADPRVMQYFPETLDRQACDRLVDRYQAHIDEHGWGFWAVEILATEQFIGFVGLQQAPPELPFAPCVEIGWRLSFDQWGQGLATEAARAALRVGFNELALPEIVSFTALDNQRSQRVMQKLGMTAEGHFIHPKLPTDSPLREHCLYRLARQTWMRTNRN